MMRCAQCNSIESYSGGCMGEWECNYTKKCSMCSKVLSCAKFGKDKSKPDYLRPNCKDCHNSKRRDYWDRNKDRLNRERREKIAEDKDAYNKKRRDWNLNNQEKYLLSKAKYRAKKKGVDFNITVDDVIIPNFCPILGIELKKNSEGFAEDSATLDRIVPELGYVKGNVAVISGRANRIKNDASLDELEKVVEWLRRSV